MLATFDPTNPPNEPLIRDLVSWLDKSPQTYNAVMDAWRTSCPRLTIWEDASDLGLVERYNDQGTTMVRATDKGREYLGKK